MAQREPFRAADDALFCRASGKRRHTSPLALSRTTAFRWHANESNVPCDYDDKYRTLTLHADGTFTDYYEHLWDLKSKWVTEGVRLVVYGGTYTTQLTTEEGLQVVTVRLHYSKIVSKINDVVMARELLEAAEEPLEEIVLITGTLDTDSTSLTVKPYKGTGAAEPQLLVAGRKKRDHKCS